jgi:hypothetical protein
MVLASLTLLPLVITMLTLTAAVMTLMNGTGMLLLLVTALVAMQALTASAHLLAH